MRIRDLRNSGAPHQAAGVVVGCALLACIAGASEPQPPCGADNRIRLSTLSWKQALARIAEHKGRVVLVDVWTTTCPVCVEEFPKVVELHRRLEEHGLVCISVNCDYDGVPGKPPAHYAPRVLQFLREQDARFEHMLLSDPLVDFLDAAEIGSTPTFLLFGRDGAEARRFDGSVEEFTIDQVALAVESAISTTQIEPQKASAD